MTSIRKFAFATLLAITTLNLAPSLASAQEPAKGKFTLAHDVRWGSAKVPAGDYEFSFNTVSISPVLSLTKISGAPAGFLVLVPMAEENKPSDLNRLTLENTPDGPYVSSMQLTDFGMTLYFNVPSHPTEKEKQMAKVVTTASASR
jgi:hypothetical protein